MRAYIRRSALLIVLPLSIILILLGVTGNYLSDGDTWARSVYNRTVYNDGHIANGSLYDRNNVLLASVKNGVITYSNDALTRVSTIHSVGDSGYNIATGALAIHGSRLVLFDPIDGVNPSLVHGGSITLSIDSGLNRLAYDALEGKNGVVAVCNYLTGELICMVSAPAFDPNNYDAALLDSQYLNRFTDGLYTPGSVFKLLTAAAAIEQLPDVYEFVYTCTGSCEIGGNDITCAKKHGELSFEDALADSCNCYFAQLALQLGAGVIGEYAAAYGLTGPVYLDTVKSASGCYNSDMYDENLLAWSGVGQSDDLINPASMLHFICAIANGGLAPQFTLLDGNVSQPVQLIKPETAEALALMMNYNTAKTYGFDNYPGLELCAKSGTAEVGEGDAPHAWFVGFLNNADAPYAFVVIVENGGWGSVTGGRIANSVLQAAVFGK